MNSMTRIIDVGMSGEGMADIYKEIYDNMYNPVVEEITKNTNSMIDSVESYWVGSSADKFKRYIKKELENALKNLESVNENIRSNMVNVSADMQAIDALAASMINKGNFVGDLSVKMSNASAAPVQNNATVSTSTIQSNEEIDSLAEEIDVGGEVKEKSLKLKDQDGFWNKVGMVAKRTGATIISAHLTPLEGLGRFGEAIIDGTAIVATGTIATPVTGIIDLFGYNIAKKKGEDYNSVTGKMWEGVRGYVQEENCKGMFDDLYNDTAFGQWTAKYTYGFGTVRKVGIGVGYAVPSILIGIATGGGSAGVQAAAIGGTYAVAGIGKNTEEAWNDGASTAKGAIYGTLSGIKEGASYAIGGLINRFMPFTNAFANAGVHVGLDMADAGVSHVSDSALKTIYKESYIDENGNEVKYDENTKWGTKFKHQYKNDGGVKGTFGQMAFAGVMSGISEGTGLAAAARGKRLKRDMGDFVAENSDELIGNIDNSIDNNSLHFDNEVKKSKTNSFFEKFYNGDRTYGVDQDTLGRTFVDRKIKNSPEFKELASSSDFKEFYQKVLLENGVPPEQAAKMAENFINKEVVYHGNVNAIKDYLMGKYNGNETEVLEQMNKMIEVNYNPQVYKLKEKPMFKDMPMDKFEELLHNVEVNDGACSYAAVMNAIYSKYADNPGEFKKIFGIDMFTEVDGKKVLNDKELFLDIYSNCNSKQIAEKAGKTTYRFDIDESGKLSIVNLDEHLNGFASGVGFDTNIINEYLKAKGTNISFDTELLLSNEPMNGIVDVAPHSLEELKTVINNNPDKQLVIGVNSANSIMGDVNNPIKFISPDGTEYINTNNWSEGTGHVVAITDIVDDGIIVSSWGKKLKIPYDGLVENWYKIYSINIGGV